MRHQANWQAREARVRATAGYTWKRLHLPPGTDLRMWHKGDYHYARVEGDRIMYQGHSVSPHEFTALVTGTVRNAWNDIWIRRPGEREWTRAADFRARNGGTDNDH